MYASKHFLPIFGKKDKDNPKNSGKRENEISFRSLNIETAILFHFFNFCIEGGYINKNPRSSIRKLNELSRLKILDDADIEKLIAAATNKLTRDLIFNLYRLPERGGT